MEPALATSLQLAEHVDRFWTPAKGKTEYFDKLSEQTSRDDSSGRPARLPRAPITVTQAGPGFDRLAYRAKNAAFDEWRLSLNPNDKLPRGRFFKGKMAGPVRALLIMDEGGMYGC